MKKILLCLLLLCSVSLQFEGIRYSLINGTFEMRLPAGYLPLYVSSGTDIDEYWKFQYPDGSYIFVSNRWSPNVQEIMSKYHYPEMAIPITNNSTVCYKGSETVVSRPDIEGLYTVPDSLFLEGFSLSARYWAEKEYKDYCVGYRNVSLSKRKAFNKAISSFCQR